MVSFDSVVSEEKIFKELAINRCLIAYSANLELIIKVTEKPVKYVEWLYICFLDINFELNQSCYL